MLAIRLARVGKKNTAQYKIVLQEHTVAPGGRHVEILGSYDPHSKKAVIKDERVKYWIEKGAQASDTAYNLLVSKGVISNKKRIVKMPKKVVEAPVSSETATGKPAEAKTEESKADLVSSLQAEVKVEETKIEAPIEEKKPEEVKPEEAKVEAPAEEKKPEEVKTEEVKTEEAKVEEVKAEEPKKE